MGNAPLFPFSSFLLGLPPIFKSHTIKPCTVKNNSLSEYVTLFHDKARTCVARTTMVSCQIESFIKMSAAFLALSFLHNLEENGAKKGSSLFDETFTF